MTQQSQHCKAVSEAVACNNTCNACQRTGLAIFPLRYAVGGLVSPGVLKQGDYPPSDRLTQQKISQDYYLRTLRQGYVYVLLKREEMSGEEPSWFEWQSYQVTERGYLRQFDPRKVPEVIVELATTCTEAHHDIDASFIHITPQKFTEAWIAFSQDSWSESVLDFYAQHADKRQRFTHIDIKTFARSPLEHPQSHDIQRFPQSVLEFSKHIPWQYEKETSLYPFHSRQARFELLTQKVSIWNRSGQGKVAGLVLEDTVAIVSELNAYRLNRAQTLKEYTEQVDIQKQLLTSEAIVGYLQGINHSYDQLKKNKPQPTASNARVYGAVVLEHERKIEQARAAHLAKFTSRYHESLRLEYTDNIELYAKMFFKQLQQAEKDYCCWINSPLWQDIWQNDYRPQDSDQAQVAFKTMMAGCLEGGVFDAWQTLDDGSKIATPMAAFWQTQLQDSQSAFYQAITAKNSRLLAGLFSDTKQAVDTTKSLLTQGFHYGGHDTSILELAETRLLLAGQGAFNYLKQTLSAKVQEAFKFLNEGMLYVRAGQATVTFTLKMTIRDYYLLEKNAVVRPFNADGTPVASKASLYQNRMMLHFSGIDRAVDVSDPVVAKQTIEVELTIAGSEKKLKSKIDQLTKGKPSAAEVQNKLGSAVTIVAAQSRFIPDLSQANRIYNQSIGYFLEQERLDKQLMSGSKQRPATGKGGLILNAILLWLNGREAIDNYLKLEQVLSRNGQSMSQLAFLANMASMSGLLIESVGMVLSKTLIKNIGGVIGATASFSDAWMQFSHAEFQRLQGNEESVDYSIKSGFAYVFSGGLAIWAIFATGPTGWIVLGLAILIAFLGKQYSIWSDDAQISLMEKWFENCAYGKRAPEAITAKTTQSPGLLAQSMSEFWALAVGMDIQINFEQSLLSPLNQIQMRTVIPEFASQYQANKQCALHYDSVLFDRQGKYCGRFIYYWGAVDEQSGFLRQSDVSGTGWYYVAGDEPVQFGVTKAGGIRVLVLEPEKPDDHAPEQTMVIRQRQHVHITQRLNIDHTIGRAEVTLTFWPNVAEQDLHYQLKQYVVLPQ